ncbi:MAG: hypothetical protein HXX18_06990 [Bacteroidetes bacterium]|nr:hypothetical protein [Bacteroidota bacterium]
MRLSSKIIVFFLLLPWVSYSQNKNYSEYYKLTNQAELKIVDSSFADALMIYQSAFNKFKNNFGQDIYNACLCAILSKQNEVAEVFLEKMVFKGYTIDQFKSNTYENFKKSKAWKLFKNKYPELRAGFLKSFDNDLKTELENMAIAESNANLPERKFDSIVYENTKRLCEIFTTMGFPKTNMFQTKTMLPVILVRHFFGLYNKTRNSPDIYFDSMYIKMDFKKYDLMNLYLKAMQEGFFYPNDYINCHDYREKNSIDCGFIINMDFKTKTCTANYPDEDKVKASNLKRIEIGLPPFESTFKIMAKSDLIWLNYPFDEYEKLISRLEKDEKYLSIKKYDDRLAYY